MQQPQLAAVGDMPFRNGFLFGSSHSPREPLQLHCIIYLPHSGFYPTWAQDCRTLYAGTQDLDTLQLDLVYIPKLRSIGGGCTIDTSQYCQMQCLPDVSST